jgi:hypothetical protein
MLPTPLGKAIMSTLSGEIARITHLAINLQLQSIKSCECVGELAKGIFLVIMTARSNPSKRGVHQNRIGWMVLSLLSGPGLFLQ